MAAWINCSACFCGGSPSMYSRSCSESLACVAATGTPCTGMLCPAKISSTACSAPDRDAKINNPAETSPSNRIRKGLEPFMGRIYALVAGGVKLLPFLSAWGWPGMRRKRIRPRTKSRPYSILSDSGDAYFFFFLPPFFLPPFFLPLFFFAFLAFLPLFFLAFLAGFFLAVFFLAAGFFFFLALTFFFAPPLRLGGWLGAEVAPAPGVIPPTTPPTASAPIDSSSSSS